jgi:hypothetical protein
MYIKQELKSFPFHIIEESIRDAVKAAIAKNEQVEMAIYESMIARKEQEFVDRNEAPDEGAIREAIQYTGLTKETLAKIRAEVSQNVLEAQVEILAIKNKASWLLPQAAAYLSSLRLPTTVEGQVDVIKFLQDTFANDDWHKGLYRYLTIGKRGSILKDQTKELGRNYCALVPLIMMPFKRYNNIPYSAWPREHLDKVLDKSLLNAVMCQTTPESFTTEQILENRDMGLKIKSGGKVGETRSPISTYKLYGSVSPEFSSLPWLSQVMLHQIWCAHPSIRTENMILNWINLDDIPKPLIDTEVFIKPAVVSAKSISYDNKLPWEL